jgi:hypothetical protein
MNSIREKSQPVGPQVSAHKTQSAAGSLRQTEQRVDAKALERALRTLEKRGVSLPEAELNALLSKVEFPKRTNQPACWSPASQPSNEWKRQTAGPVRLAIIDGGGNFIMDDHAAATSFVAAKAANAPVDALSQVDVPKAAMVPLEHCGWTPRTLQAQMTEHVVSFISQTNHALETLLKDPSSRGAVVNQSMGEGLASSLKVLLEDEGFSKAFGLTAADTLKDKATKMLPVVKRALADPKVKAERTRYEALSKALEKAQILHVIGIGNEREVVNELRKAGVALPASFTDHLLWTPQKIMVAASTGGQHESIAGFSTPNKRVTLAIDGTSVLVGPDEVGDGTSFSAPQVAGLIRRLRDSHEVSNDQIRAILRGASKDTVAPSNDEGWGVLQPEVAMKRLEALKPKLKLKAQSK